MNMPLDSHTLELESQAAASANLLHGLVVAAGTTDTLDLLWAWGDASVLPKRRTMSSDSVFDVASLTKVVATASACAVCIHRGTLVPDAPATEYVPRLAQFPGSVIRVCDLASHCSGYDNRKFDTCTSGWLVRAIETPAQWPSRQRFEYSCRNFLVLGHIVEQVTGEDLATFCDNNVFAPLGMTHTAFAPIQTGVERVVPTEQPAGTISDGQARKAGCPIGNAGLFSSAPDLVVFCQMMLRGGKAGPTHLFDDNALGWLMRPCSPPGIPLRSFGWDMRPCSECLHRPAALSKSAIGHSGWTGQSMWLDPDLGLYVIVLTNRTHIPGNTDVSNYESSMRFRARIADVAISHLV